MPNSNAHAAMAARTNAKRLVMLGAYQLNRVKSDDMIVAVSACVAAFLSAWQRCSLASVTRAGQMNLDVHRRPRDHHMVIPPTPPSDARRDGACPCEAGIHDWQGRAGKSSRAVSAKLT